MLNKAVLIGRLVHDPELKYTAGGGIALATFTLAVDRPYTDRESGEREADFLDVTAWRKLAENCTKFLAKGGQAAVVGRIKTRSYDDNQGIRRKAWEIEADDARFLQRAPAGSSGADEAAPEIETGADFPS